MAKKEEQEQQPEETPPVDPMVAAAENIIAGLSKGSTYGGMQPQALAYPPIGAEQPASGMVSGGPVPMGGPVGGPTEGPGMTQGGMVYDPTAGGYPSSTAMQDLDKKKKK